MGRKCAVPHCYTGYRKCKEKASLYKVPDDDFFLNKWQEAIAREDRPITPKDYVCEKHFKEDDIQRTRVIKNVVEVYLRPKLRPDAIPSIFPDLPEFILKMVKKRRKLLPQDMKKINHSEVATDDNEDTKETDLNKGDQEKDVKEEAILNESCNSEGTDNITNNEIEIKSENEESVEKEQDQLNEDHNREKIYRCEECEYETKYPHNLRTHQTKHLTGEEAYIHCEICPDYKTKWELTYRNHMKIKHGVGSQEIFNCFLCDYKTRVKICLKRHIDRHNRQLPTEQKLKCEYPECNFECDSKALLNMHILIHKEDESEHKSFKCTECLYSTNSKTHILKHIKSAHNTGDDTVVSVGAKKSDKTIHKRRRPNGKPLYRCVKCAFQTQYHSFLLKHLIIHKEGETKYNTINISKVWKCSKCPYATFFQHALEAHQEADCEKYTNLDKMEVSQISNYKLNDICNDEKEDLNETDSVKSNNSIEEVDLLNGDNKEEEEDTINCNNDKIEIIHEEMKEENLEIVEEIREIVEDNQEITKDQEIGEESHKIEEESHENREGKLGEFPKIMVKEEHD